MPHLAAASPATRARPKARLRAAPTTPKKGRRGALRALSSVVWLRPFHRSGPSLGLTLRCHTDRRHSAFLDALEGLLRATSQPAPSAGLLTPKRSRRTPREGPAGLRSPLSNTSAWKGRG